MEAAIHSPVLTNALGHLAGIVAFGAFLLLLLRGARRGTWVDAAAPVAAAGLALCWNLGSFAVLLAPPGSRGGEVVASLSFASLSLLPAVLFHLALGRDHVRLRAAGYAAGVLAAALHLTEVAGVPVSALEPSAHQLGIDLTIYGFTALSALSVLRLTLERSTLPGAAMRALTAMSLFLLAVSFVHFGDHGPSSWSHELVFHHAAIPLALFVLLQDYRFLMLDAFVRHLGAALLAAVFSASLLWGFTRLGWLRLDPAFGPGLLAVCALSAMLLMYPYARDRLRLWVEAGLFRRGDLSQALQRVRALEAADVQGVLEQSAAVIAEFVSARRWRLSDSDGAPPGFRALTSDQARGGESFAGADSWAECAVALRVSPDRSRQLWLGPRIGGRRYLSDDVRDLEQLADEAAARLDALRRAEQQRLLAESEFAALRAQINPHFLFNALNALYGVIPRSAADARRTLLNLADILRYTLDSRRQFVAVEEEMRVVEAYLEVERLRLGDRLAVTIEQDEAARLLETPVLTIQPLVENAVKHGISGKPDGGSVAVKIEFREGRLAVAVTDDGVGFNPHSIPESSHGLRNVRRRLNICYGEAAEFNIESSAAGTRVCFSAPADAQRRAARDPPDRPVPAESP